MRLLITCPPMILRLEQCKHLLENYEVIVPEFTQTMTEEKLMEIIPTVDAWIAGDDPVSRRVLESGNLKCVIKWGIGVDNVDFEAVKDLNLKFSNTPGMFGDEVADVAIGYLISLTRQLHNIDREIRRGNWTKPSGISLKDKKVALIGFGDIGRNVARRLLALKTDVHVYDPGFVKEDHKIKCVYRDLEIETQLHEVNISDLESVLTNSRIVILCCPSNKDTFHLINNQSIQLLHNNCYIVNVSRGALVDEDCIIENLSNGKINGFASDVFENEPISVDHKLLGFGNVIVGSHNASNTIDAVDRTNIKVIEILKEYC